MRLIQIYLLAAKPTKLTTTLFRIQMNNLNGPFLAFLFPEVECRTLPFEQATYWIQHGMLYIIPAYILRTGAYQVEEIKDYNWAIIGVQTQLIYHFGVLNFVSIVSNCFYNTYIHIYFIIFGLHNFYTDYILREGLIAMGHIQSQ